MRRPGLSRIEVVLLVAMLGVVAGLVMRGVQRVREAAAQMSCKNNLKQLAIAAQTYGDASGRLPPLVDLGEETITGEGLVSSFFALIPYIEATSTRYPSKESPRERYHGHSSLTFTGHGKDGDVWTQHGGDANQVWKTFLCPTDTTAVQLRDVPMTLPNGTVGHYATGSYAANGSLHWGIKRDGKSPIDGLSQTILIAERPQICRTADGDTVYNLWGLGFYSPHMPAFAALAPVGSPEAWTTGQFAPVFPLDDDPIRFRIGRGDAPPQEMELERAFQKITLGGACDPRLPGSTHRIGMNAAMGDGSVRVYSYDNSPAVFWAACQSARVPD